MVMTNPGTDFLPGMKGSSEKARFKGVFCGQENEIPYLTWISLIIVGQQRVHP